MAMGTNRHPSWATPAGLFGDLGLTGHHSDLTGHPTVASPTFHCAELRLSSVRTNLVRPTADLASVATPSGPLQASKLLEFAKIPLLLHAMID